MSSAEHIQVFRLMRFVLRHLVKVLEERILSDGLRAALPVDKLEFRYPEACLKVKRSTSISGAEGNVSAWQKRVGVTAMGGRGNVSACRRMACRRRGALE